MKSIVDGIRIFLAVAMPYFRSEDRVRGRLLLAAVVAAELGLVYVAVAVTQWNARFFNALEAKNWAAFQDELIVFCFIARRAPSSPACRSIISARRCRSAGGAG